MIQLIGIRHDVDVSIREKLSIIQKHVEDSLKRVINVCDEAVIISTCNRTEVYYNSRHHDINKVAEVFECLGWDKDLIQHTFHLKGKDAVKHLMEVSCGYDSIILGEDQILGQIKDAYEKSLGAKTVTGDMLRLFQSAITCGKEFRSKSGLYRVPVSSASMVVREAKKRDIKRFMILGFGEVGNLASKYIINGDYDILYIAVRDISSVNLSCPNVNIISFGDRKNYYSEVDCIISCTSAPHTVIRKEDLPDKKFLIFDLAVPRDVDDDVYTLADTEVFNIDKIGTIQDENYQRRKQLMQEYRSIVDGYIGEFEDWLKLKELSPSIQNIRRNSETVYKNRSVTFRNKKYTKNNEILVETLLKSVSNTYVNRAIEVLKEEYLKGRGEECLRIIEQIFVVQE